MRILITGGAGFIGSHLVDRLMEEGTNEVMFHLGSDWGDLNNQSINFCYE